MLDKIKTFVKENKVCQYIWAHKIESAAVVLLAANLYLLGKSHHNEVHIYLNKDDEIYMQ